MNKKIILFIIIGLILAAIISFVIWILFKPPTKPETSDREALGNCQSLTKIQNQIFCLDETDEGLGFYLVDPESNKINLFASAGHLIIYEQLFWNPQKNQIIIKNASDLYSLIEANRDTQPLEVMTANWYNENEIIAAKKIDDQYQLVTISPESQEIIRTFSSLDIVPEYIEVSPDKTTLLMIYPTDIADEKSLVIWKNGKANILKTDLAIIKAGWLDESHLLALTNEGITLLDLINNKQKTLIENPELIDIIFHYNNSLDILSIYDTSTNQIKDFDIQMPALKTQKDLEGLSEITQIYKEQSYYWVIANDQLYKLEL